MTGSASTGSASTGPVSTGPDSTGPDSDRPDLPGGIGRPATRALTAAGHTRLDRLADLTEADLLALHGVGPKAVRILRDALAARGMSFRPR